MRALKFRAWDNMGKYYLNNFMYNFNLSVLISNISHYEIEQFTGLLDKNGKEIYQGDIVKYVTSQESGIAVISSWIGNNLYFEWIHSSVPPTNSDIFGCKEELEVIGNIHENPELLEVSK